MSNGGDWSQVSPEALCEFFLSAGTANTRRAYRLDLDAFKGFLGVETHAAAVRRFCDLSMGAARLTTGQYLQWLMDNGASANTTRRRIGSLRGLAKKARECGIIGWSVDVTLPPATPIRDVMGPGRGKFEDMLALCLERCDAKGFRDAAILELLYFAALRSSELLSLELKHVDLAKRTVKVRAKRRWDRQEVPIPIRAADAVQVWLKYRGNGQGPLFPAYTGRKGKMAKGLAYSGLYQIIRLLGRKVGIPCHPHGLRHSAITDCLRLTNGNIPAAMEFSRHRKPETVMAYLDGMREKGRDMAEIVAANRHQTPGNPYP